MKWKQIKADASGVVALFVAGATILMLSFLNLPSHRIRLGRGGPEVNREAQPSLYWACESVEMMAGIVCLVSGACVCRALIRQQRDQKRNLEQQAIDSFIGKHDGHRH